MKVNVGEILTRRARRDPHAEGLVDWASGRRFTYRQLNERANRAGDLLARLGVRTGDRIAILAKNGPEFMETFFGCSKLGIVVVPLNWRLVADELDRVMEVEVRAYSFAWSRGNFLDSLKAGYDAELLESRAEIF